MSSLWRTLHAEFFKWRHTFLPWIHFGLPTGFALVVVSYAMFTTVAIEVIISAYFQILGAAYPLVIGIVTSKAVELERDAGDYQVMMSSGLSRMTAYGSKILVLLLAGGGSVALGIGVFGAYAQTLSAEIYLWTVVLLMGGAAMVYILHVFVSFRFGSGVSIGLGILETLFALLGLTGLGDGIWYYAPPLWSARLAGYMGMLGQVEWGMEFRQWLTVAVPMTIVALMLSLWWFSRWNGRKE